MERVTSLQSRTVCRASVCPAGGNPFAIGQIACVLETPTHAVFEMYPAIDCTYPCNYSFLVDVLPENVVITCDQAAFEDLSPIGTICTINCTAPAVPSVDALFVCDSAGNWLGPAFSLAFLHRRLRHRRRLRADWEKMSAIYHSIVL